MSKLFALARLMTTPSHVKVLTRNSLKLKLAVSSNVEHLEAAISWLEQAQDATPDGGCSASYHLLHRWAPSYPETTGYIISTFVDYSQSLKETNPDRADEIMSRAKRMGDWECDIQMDSGAVRGEKGITEYPIVFNTGQVILGWTSLYDATGDTKYLDSAKRAGDWLLEIQEPDGKWLKHTHNDMPHAYHSRVAWSLLKLYASSGVEAYKEGAAANMRWIMSTFNEVGWSEEMSFAYGVSPLTHLIAYTLRGLLECAAYFDNDFGASVTTKVIETSEILLHRYERNKKSPDANPEYFPATFDANWKADADYSCVTGNAQMAIVWLKIYRLNGDARFLNTSMKILDQVKETQDIKTNHVGIRGAIPGAYPISGKYMQYSYPNWATKFFADALLLLEEILDGLEQ